MSKNDFIGPFKNVAPLYIEYKKSLGYKSEAEFNELNKLDRYHLILDAMKYVKVNKSKKQALINKCEETLKYHNEYIKENGVDIPEVVNFKWNREDTK